MKNNTKKDVLHIEEDTNVKRILAILLCAMILFSVSNSLAYDQEITFQGIPWGSTRAEWTEKLKAIYGDNIVRIFKGSVTHYLEFKMKKKNLISNSTDQEVPIDIITITDKIGGYDVENLYFSSVVVDGYEKNSDTGTLLYQTEICLLVNDAKKAEKDLLDKLSTLYEKNSKTIKNVGDFKLTLRYWLGANDTYLLMGKGSQIDGKDTILLMYGKMIDPKTFIEQSGIETLTPEPFSEASPSDYSGL